MLWKILTFLVGIAILGVVINFIAKFATLAIGWKLGSIIVTILLIVALIYLVRRILA